jgi:nitroimidazol reductase NimA-like FMN-containing flavoprotein (pyridoxamine 5'-phosphate oxidase superfamily)
MRERVPERLRVKREPQRAVYDRETIAAILDEALICHLGFEVEGQPYVIPTLHARVGDVLYVHGSAASRMLRHAAGGAPVCVTVTLLDGLVLARSVYNHSMNYRSVVVLGRARELSDRDEKIRAMHRVVEHVVPGRWDDARQPSEAEIKSTTILALPLDEASAKIRTGPPTDDEADLELPVWAGTIPLMIQPAEPVPAAGVSGPPPGYAADYGRLT